MVNGIITITKRLENSMKMKKMKVFKILISSNPLSRNIRNIREEFEISEEEINIHN